MGRIQKTVCKRNAGPQFLAKLTFHSFSSRGGSVWLQTVRTLAELKHSICQLIINRQPVTLSYDTFVTVTLGRYRARVAGGYFLTGNENKITFNCSEARHLPSQRRKSFILENAAIKMRLQRIFTNGNKSLIKRYCDE